MGPFFTKLRRLALALREEPAACARRHLLPAALVFLAFCLTHPRLHFGGHVPPGWAAYGVVFAFLLLDGWAALPGLLAGTALGLFTLSHALPPPPGSALLLNLFLLALTVGLPAASVAILRRRRPSIDLGLRHTRDLAPILLHGFLIAATDSLVWLLVARPPGFPLPALVELFFTWFLKQSLGPVLLTPALLRFLSQPDPFGDLRRHARRRPVVLLEEITLYVSIPVVTLITLFNPWSSSVLRGLLPTIGFPYLIWATARFGLRGALLFSLIRDAFVIGAASQGYFLVSGGDVTDRELAASAHLIISGAVSLFVGVIFEERRLLILRLTESEARIQSLLRHSPLPITIKDAHGLYLLVNPAAEAAFGQGAPALLGKTDEEIFHHTGHILRENRTVSSDSLVLSTRRPVTVEEMFTGRNGLRHYSTTKFPLLDSADIPHAICSMSIDITELQRAERERDRFFTLAPDFFCVLRFDGRIVRANPSFLRFNRLTPEQALRKNIHDLVHPADLPLSRRHFHPGAESHTAEIRWSVPASAASAPEPVLSWTVFADHESDLLFASGRDVSERRRDERILLEAIETADRMAREAEVANRSKTSFLAVMTHELRTPLNGILGAASLLETTGLSDEQNDYTRIMTNCGESLQRLVTDILDFAKSEAGRIVMAEEAFDVRAALDEVVSTLSPAATKKNLALFLVCPPLPSPLLGDALRLRQVLLNLAGNAVKFSERGRVIIRALVEREEDTYVRLHFEVEDSGPGIAQEAFPLLFKPFSQADDSPTRSHGGAGLGLAISKNLVELMEGEINVRSEPGKGSLFYFTARFKKAPGETL